MVNLPRKMEILRIENEGRTGEGGRERERETFLLNSLEIDWS